MVAGVQWARPRDLLDERLFAMDAVIMQLRQADINTSYSMLRLVSENSVWEVGIYPTLYGARVSCGRIGQYTYLKGGYCCGAQGYLLMVVFMSVAFILQSFPESATMKEVDNALSDWELRPIDRDDGLNKLFAAVKARIDLDLPVTPFGGAGLLDALTDVCDNIEQRRQEAIRYQAEELGYEF